MARFQKRTCLMEETFNPFNPDSGNFDNNKSYINLNKLIGLNNDSYLSKLIIELFLKRL